MVVTRDVAKDPAQTTLITKYKTLVAPIASKVIGQITADVTRAGNPAGESALGDLIADAQLADESVVAGSSAAGHRLHEPRRHPRRSDLRRRRQYGEAPR